MKSITAKLGFGTVVALVALSLAVEWAMAGPRDLMSGSQMFDASMQPILDNYLKIQVTLASDLTENVRELASKIATHSVNIYDGDIEEEHADHYKNMPYKIKEASLELSIAENLETAREAFKKLSIPMAMWGTMAKPKNVVVVACSTVKGAWLQKIGEIRNPYLGADRLNCGEIVGGGDR